MPELDKTTCQIQEAYYIQFQEYIRQKAAITQEDFEIIRSHFQYKKLEKGTVMWREGGSCHSLAFLAKGLTRSYFLDHNGKETTRRLAVENNMVAAYGSYVFERPSEETIVTVEQSHFLMVSREADMRLQADMESYRIFRNRTVEQEFVATLRFLDGFLSNDASFRYRRLAKYSPEIFNRIPLKHIASLIGVSPTQLSRIRAKKE